MKFVQFLRNGIPSLGLVKTSFEKNSTYIDLCAGNGNIPRTMMGFISAGENVFKAAKEIYEKGEHVISEKEIELLPPITKMDKVLCVGLNYSDHCDEMKVPLPKQPVIFSKFPSTIVGPRDTIDYSGNITEALDWEIELAVIIGKTAKNIEVSKALDYVFGYSVALDMSARDYLEPSFNAGQYLLGKAMSTFCPIGPSIVTPDEIEDPQSLSIRCSVNDVIKQNGNTRSMVHNVASLIAYITKFITLLPGDVILTGTPPGVGAGRNPKEFLKKGDEVECEIERIGQFKIKVT